MNWRHWKDAIFARYNHNTYQVDGTNIIYRGDTLYKKNKDKDKDDIQR